MIKNVACIIPTYNGIATIEQLLNSLLKQTVQFDLYFVDSKSKDGTYEFLCSKNCIIDVVSPDEFNHGGTRQMMVDRKPGYDIYIFITQDCILASQDSLANLIANFDSSSMVGAVCGRQLPHRDANAYAAHARYFNYPTSRRISTKFTIKEHGIKSVFISNSFCAYSGCALNEVGGFPSDVILSEDMYVAAKMILANYSIIYEPEAIAYHSHNYTTMEEFRRYFDIGVFNGRESWIAEKFGGVNGEGLRFIVSEVKFFGISGVFLIPNIIIRTIFKFCGYFLGKNEKIIPDKIKTKLSMHKKFWLRM